MSSSFQILYFPYVTSTQEVAKNILKENIVIVADSQKSGRGRFNRRWYSPPGGLWCTLILKSNIEPQIISLLAGVSTVKALKKFKVSPCLKWPNDILFKNKKLGGIIGEFYKGFILLGIGINLQNEIPKEIDQIAINLPHITRDELLIQILQYLEEDLKKEKIKIIEEWKKYNCTLGKRVKIIENEEYIGTAIDITEDGFLLVESGGKLKKVVAGDVVHLE